MAEIREEIGSALLSARKKAHITRVDIASRLGVSDVAVYYWEIGRNPIDVDVFKKYCDIVHVDWIDMLESLPSEKKKSKIDN